MTTRKYKLERTETTLTVRTVKSGFMGRDVTSVFSAAFAALAVTSIIQVAGHLTHRAWPDFTGAMALELWCVLILLIYQGEFGPASFELDGEIDQVRVGGVKRAALSIIASACVDRVWFPTPSIGAKLFLETESGESITIFRTGLLGVSDETLEALALNVNGFIAERRAHARRDRPAIWSWAEIREPSPKASQ